MADIVDKKPDIMIENPTKSIVPVETTATHDTGEHPPTRMEKMFIHVGTAVAYHPWKFIIGSVLISCALASGFFTVLVAENRPEKQWVPTGAAALEQKAYVDATWPSTQRFNFWIAQCKKDDAASQSGGGGDRNGQGGGKKKENIGKDCNIFAPKYVQRLQLLNQQIMDIVVDGDEVHKQDKFKDIPEETWTKWGYNGKFQFFENRTKDFETKSKCFKFGPFCGKRTILDIFRDDDEVVNKLTAAEAEQAINFWEGQDNFCPVSIAKLDSPCVDTSKHNADANKLGTFTILVVIIVTIDFHSFIPLLIYSL